MGTLLLANTLGIPTRLESRVGNTTETLRSVSVGKRTVVRIHLVGNVLIMQVHRSTMVNAIRMRAQRNRGLMFAQQVNVRIEWGTRELMKQTNSSRSF